jgi:hypothetical protein
MPEEQTVERAREDAREGKSASTQAGEFVREEIHHVREGKHGARSPQQAIELDYRRRVEPESSLLRLMVQPQFAGKRNRTRTLVNTNGESRRRRVRVQRRMRCGGRVAALPANQLFPGGPSGAR